MRALKTIVVFCVCVVVLGVLGIAGLLDFKHIQTSDRQRALEPFYTSPSPLPDGKPGDVIRVEPLTGNFTVPGATASRFLYLTQDASGAPRVSSGMLFVPESEAPTSGRRIVAWAHPTVGMGNNCAPSRNSTPTALMDWLPGMIRKGWVVTATDYAGLGTEGTEQYLIAEAEVHDVVNSVRAARNIVGPSAGREYTIFGHSQGGHTALWAGTLAPKYAPELKLLGVAGAAPAAPLRTLVEQLWDTQLAWVIGAEVFVSYPTVYPAATVESVGTPQAVQGYEDLAQECLIPGILESDVRWSTGQRFFQTNPLYNPAWAAAIDAQTAPPTKPDLPVLVTESVNDGVVVPQVVAGMVDQWCRAGSHMTANWLGPLRGDPETLNVQSHMYEGAVGGALATTWMEQLFRGETPAKTCGQRAPLALEPKG